MRAKFGNLIFYYLILLLIISLLVASVASLAAPSPGLQSLQPSVPTQAISTVDNNNRDTILSNDSISDSPSTEKPGITQGNPVGAAISSQAGDTINFGSLKLVNNEWGAPADEKLTSAVYFDQSRHFGWYWNRQEPKTKQGTNSLFPIYPSVRIGGNHQEQSNLKYFPVKMGEIKTLNFLVDYNYPEQPTGIFNLAYDMFLLDRDKSGPDAVRKAEIMIWLHGTLGQMPLNYKGDFTDEYNTYALYSFTMSDGRLYHAFVMKGPPQFQSQHKVDVKRLLNNLDLDPNWYLPGIELGNEIVNGCGKIEINQFSINVNGSIIEE